MLSFFPIKLNGKEPCKNAFKKLRLLCRKFRWNFILFFRPKQINVIQSENKDSNPITFGLNERVKDWPTDGLLYSLRV